MISRTSLIKLDLLPNLQFQSIADFDFRVFVRACCGLMTLKFDLFDYKTGLRVEHYKGNRHGHL